MLRQLSRGLGQLQLTVEHRRIWVGRRNAYTRALLLLLLLLLTHQCERAGYGPIEWCRIWSTPSEAKKTARTHAQAEDDVGTGTHL